VHLASNSVPPLLRKEKNDQSLNSITLVTGFPAKYANDTYEILGKTVMKKYAKGIKELQHHFRI